MEPEQRRSSGSGVVSGWDKSREDVESQELASHSACGTKDLSSSQEYKQDFFPSQRPPVLPDEDSAISVSSEKRPMDDQNSFPAPMTLPEFYSEGSGVDVSQQPHGGIEVDDAWTDPGFESDGSSFLSQISSSIDAYYWENGRRYHGYKEGRYPLPNDELELDREDMKHQEMMLITDGQLHMAPIIQNPQRILDVGTGTGIWAMEMADKFPSAAVVGTDLSPVQPKWVPPNLSFEIDDVEAAWTYMPNTFDLIHVRFMFLAVKDFPRMLRQAMIALKPGGYIELSELAVDPRSHDNTLPQDSQILLWIRLLREASTRMGYDMTIAQSFKRLVLDAGFEEVTEDIREVPWGGWPKDRRLKTIGIFHKEQLKQGLQGIVMGLFTRSLGWTQAEVEVFLIKLREEINSRDIHVTDHAHIVYGRKPLGATHMA
ncbi:MAG: hypothetical protein M1833_006188 [Piccolia ochrophora]|nr:MAG: hypothetical protein M1833_006188 [Piccolia ochrophora]